VSQDQRGQARGSSIELGASWDAHCLYFTWHRSASSTPPANPKPHRKAIIHLTHSREAGVPSGRSKGSESEGGCVLHEELSAVADALAASATQTPLLHVPQGSAWQGQPSGTARCRVHWPPTHSTWWHSSACNVQSLLLQGVFEESKAHHPSGGTALTSSYRQPPDAEHHFCATSTVGLQPKG